MRKLSSDVFDQVKTVKGAVDLQALLDREREQNKQLLAKAQQDNEDRVQEMWSQVRAQLQQDVALLQSAQTGTAEVLSRMKGQLEQKMASAPQGGSSASADQRVAALQADLKSLTSVLQRFIDEHLQDKVTLVRSKNKPFESKIDTLEWLARYANFYAPESVYSLLTAFKEIYTGSDTAYRNAYIMAQHSSDAVFIIIAGIKSEINKMTGAIVASSQSFGKNLAGNAVMQSNETRIAFYLNIMEPLLVNDMNNGFALQSGLLELLVSLLRT